MAEAKKAQVVETTEGRTRRKTQTGTVVGDKMDKTRVVSVTRRYRHAFYGKIMTKRAKFYAHDEKNEAKTGDLVEIMETRPMSKLKRWRVVRVIEKAPLSAV